MQFIGSEYHGLTTDDGKRFDGLGTYRFPNGDRYVGGMLDGVFHGHGILFFRKRQKSAQGSRTTEAAAAATKPAAAAAVEEYAEENRYAKDSDEAALMGFLDGSSRPSNAASTAAPHEPTAPPSTTSDEDEVWSGQFRGVWRYGRNISGSYVFADGLVYSSETHPSGSADREQRHLHAKDGGSTAMVWTYCESTDRRVWSEHLRNITPVLPYETPLGGIALQEALTAQKQEKGVATAARLPLLWTETPILVPSSPDTDLTPSVFADGQPKRAADVERWRAALEQCSGQHAKQRETAKDGDGEEDSAAVYDALETIAKTIALPTEPLVEEQDPDVEVDEHGVATGRNRRRRVTDPNFATRYLATQASRCHAGDGVMAYGESDNKRVLTACLPVPSRSAGRRTSSEDVKDTHLPNDDAVGKVSGEASAEAAEEQRNKSRGSSSRASLRGDAVTKPSPSSTHHEQPAAAPSNVPSEEGTREAAAQASGSAHSVEETGGSRPPAQSTRGSIKEVELTGETSPLQAGEPPLSQPSPSVVASLPFDAPARDVLGATTETPVVCARHSIKEVEVAAEVASPHSMAAVMDAVSLAEKEVNRGVSGETEEGVGEEGSTTDIA